MSIIHVEVFHDDGLPISNSKRIIVSSEIIRIEISKCGDLNILEEKKFCKTCDNHGGARYHYAQDESVGCRCPICNGGDMATWKREKKNWEEFLSKR